VAVELAAPPRRIVCLYPSGTETLAALGAGERLAGRTAYCPAHPGAPAMGGTKNPDLAKILALRPDLVVANVDENRKEDVEALERETRVFVTDPRRAADVPETIRALAQVAGTPPEAAEALAMDAERAIASREAAVAGAAPRRAACLIWKDPWWTVGGGTYASDMMRLAGLANVFAALPIPYFPVERAALEAARPDLLLFPDEPFRFTPASAAPLLDLAPGRFFDGSLLTWHGARTARALAALPGLLA
jgi:ABC-type Fe3+-hydroxamate transport system substrate-binding protein